MVIRTNALESRRRTTRPPADYAHGKNQRDFAVTLSIRTHDYCIIIIIVIIIALINYRDLPDTMENNCQVYRKKQNSPNTIQTSTSAIRIYSIVRPHSVFDAHTYTLCGTIGSFVKRTSVYIVYD